MPCSLLQFLQRSRLARSEIGPLKGLRLHRRKDRRRLFAATLGAALRFMGDLRRCSFLMAKLLCLGFSAPLSITPFPDPGTGLAQVLLRNRLRTTRCSAQSPRRPLVARWALRRKGSRSDQFPPE